MTENEKKVEENKIRYYWCVNCGHHGDFGFYRTRNIKCDKCGNIDVTPFEKEDWEYELKIRGLLK